MAKKKPGSEEIPLHRTDAEQRDFDQAAAYYLHEYPILGTTGYGKPSCSALLSSMARAGYGGLVINVKEDPPPTEENVLPVFSPEDVVNGTTVILDIPTEINDRE